MSTRFELGDRVIISGQIVKTHADGCTQWLPMRMAAMSGVIVGARTLRNGRTEWTGERFHPEGDPIRAWQVAYDLRIRPVHCLDHQVEHEALANERLNGVAMAEPYSTHVLPSASNEARGGMARIRNILSGWPLGTDCPCIADGGEH